MVKLINWKNASREEKIRVKKLLREDNYDVYIILLEDRKFIEYLKSHDLDSGEKLIIRREKKGDVLKEIKKLKEEGFSIKLVISFS